MNRYLLSLLLLLPFGLYARLLFAQLAAVNIYGAVNPPAAGIVVHLIQPGGLERTAETAPNGDWLIGVNWRAGLYHLWAEKSTDSYDFDVPAGQTLSGPWVFQLELTPTPTVPQIYLSPTVAPKPSETPFPTLPMPTELMTYQPTPRTATATLTPFLPTPLPSATATMPSPTATWTPLPTEVYLVWQFSGELVMRPTARAWTLTISVEGSPINYDDVLSALIQRILEESEP